MNFTCDLFKYQSDLQNLLQRKNIPTSKNTYAVSFRCPSFSKIIEWEINIFPKFACIFPNNLHNNNVYCIVSNRIKMIKGE